MTQNPLILRAREDATLYTTNSINTAGYPQSKLKRMKGIAFLCSLALLICCCQGLSHRVDVFVKRSGADIGSTVEMRTNVRFFGTDVSETQTRNGIEESRGFAGLGMRIFEYVIEEDPVSILVSVTEDDGAGTNPDDGVCRVLIQPESFEEGTARYECYRDSNNGLSVEWTIIILISSFTPIG